MNEQLTAVSLFAGVGGIDLALERAGVDVVAAVEIDNAARGVLAHRFPKTTLFTDVMEVNGEQLLSAGFIPERGIIAGGFPCQDLSHAGRRAGLEGRRSGLFWQIVRLVDELRPRWLLLENVPGLLSSNGGRDMGTVVRAMEERGYSVGWRVLDAQHFGVAQRRRRIFLVCHSGDERSAPAQILFEPEGGRRDSSSSFESREDSSRASADSTRNDSPEAGVKGFTLGSFASYSEGVGTLKASGGDIGGGSETLITYEPVGEVVGPLTCGMGGTRGSETSDSKHLAIGTYSVFPKSGQGAELRAIETDTAPTLTTSQSERGIHITAVPIQDSRPVEKHQRGLGVGQEDDPSYTLDTVSRQGVATYRKAKRAQNPEDYETWVEAETTNTLNVFENTSDVRATSLIVEPALLDGTRVGDARLNTDGISPTVIARWGTGGGNVPVVVPRDYAFDEFNSSINPETHHTLRAGTRQSTGVVSGLNDFAIVRRLTPTECERLQGFPDGWTSHRIDWKKNELIEQKDAPRYKQMGNAVAVPVVEWISRRIVAFERGEL